MMSEMILKVDTMQGRSYYKLKLYMMFEYATFSFSCKHIIAFIVIIEIS